MQQKNYDYHPAFDEYRQITSDAGRIGPFRRVLLMVVGAFTVWLSVVMGSLAFYQTLFDLGRLVALCAAATLTIPAIYCIVRAVRGK